MKQLIFIIFIAAIAVAAYLTNPQPGQHRDAAQQRVGELLQASMGKKNPLFDSPGGPTGQRPASSVLAHVVNSDNYYLFSTTTLTSNGVANVVGVGAFGRVFLGEKFNRVYKSMTEKATE